MNTEAPLNVCVPLKFPGQGHWTLRAFSDTQESWTTPAAIAETRRAIDSAETLELTPATA
jgi:hypothetical protein